MRILGTPVDLVTRSDAERWVRDWLAGGTSCAHVVTLNPEYVMTARRDAVFADALEESRLATIDGAGVALAARLLSPGAEVERVTGVEICWLLGQISADTGIGLFLLGAGPGVADTAAGKLRQAFPGVVFAGTWAEGSPRRDHDEVTIARIAASGADVLLVAYGAPGQIHWIARNQAALSAAGVKLVVGIGGALDYISGNVPWAPGIVRRLGLEWAYRLVREPWRWRRQLVLPRFAMLVLRDAVMARIKFRSGRQGLA